MLNGIHLLNEISYLNFSSIVIFKSIFETLFKYINVSVEISVKYNRFVQNGTACINGHFEYLLRICPDYPTWLISTMALFLVALQLSSLNGLLSNWCNSGSLSIIYSHKSTSVLSSVFNFLGERQN